MKIHVWYHAGCWDGFGAAWAVHRAYQDGRLKGTPHFEEIQYGAPLPVPLDEIEEQDEIYFLDFAPKPKQLTELLLRHPKRVLILDHHKTAMEALDGFVHSSLEKHFATDQSGAVMAWGYFNEAAEMPAVLCYVQDRDLWRWNLPESKAVNAWIRSIPKHFENWDSLFLDGLLNWNAAALKGNAILGEQDRVVAEHVAHSSLVEIGGYTVLCVNATFYLSEIAGVLSEESHNGFGAAYFIRADGKVAYELRSRGDFDVSEIAKKYGGGGHKNAAGFEVDEPLQ